MTESEQKSLLSKYAKEFATKLYFTNHTLDIKILLDIVDGDVHISIPEITLGNGNANKEHYSGAFPMALPTAREEDVFLLDNGTLNIGKFDDRLPEIYCPKRLVKINLKAFGNHELIFNPLDRTTLYINVDGSMRIWFDYYKLKDSTLLIEAIKCKYDYHVNVNDLYEEIKKLSERVKALEKKDENLMKILT